MDNPLIQARSVFGESHPEQSVQVRGRQWGLIDVPAHDEAPVLLLLPGTLGRADIFWSQISHLKGRARVVSLSYPASYDIAQWVADILSLMTRLNANQFHVLGSSLGGYVAQLLAATDPARVLGLVAANTMSDAQWFAQKPPYSGDLLNTPIPELRAGFAGGMGQWAQAHPEQASVVELLLEEVAGRIPARHLRARLLAMKYAPTLARVALASERVAVVEVADDPLIPPPVRERVRDFLQPALTYRFSSGGHFPYLARPEVYNNMLDRLLGLVTCEPAPENSIVVL